MRPHAQTHTQTKFFLVGSHGNSPIVPINSKKNLKFVDVNIENRDFLK